MQTGEETGVIWCFYLLKSSKRLKWIALLDQPPPLNINGSLCMTSCVQISR